MHFSKKQVEPIPEEETTIWTCSNEGCSCWMRDNFSFVELPACPICNSTMISDTKLLPILTNGTKKSFQA
ncbi:cold-shock protein [Paenibacillus sp. sptzw28]|uniref:cold-shock protein n=1 Tax=Paenibacillus sp. sptzw28 TaxID=715179 RepID=UPI001C6E31B0|nr:cold-shock protein [Paenibacillus sp. sptzw28]QYR23996.1 cold-shock protein [Paenibacillus sp. sptzw28]